jgi:hypothetical protein
MIPTFLDLRTGKTAKGNDMSVLWWTDSGCDCNRMINFDEGVQEEMHAAQALAHSELQPHQSICFGCKRFVAIDVEGELVDVSWYGSTRMSKEEVLAVMNKGYIGSSRSTGPQLYPPALDVSQERAKYFQQLLVALRSQKVNGKHVAINLHPLQLTYAQVERLLGNFV